MATKKDGKQNLKKKGMATLDNHTVRRPSVVEN
jgi:hypothetical protein